MSAPSAQCPPLDLLEAVAAGQRADGEFHEHIATCGPCRQALENIRESNQFLSGFAIDGSLPSVPLAAAAREIDIPGYAIVREIHRGGQGVVYLALQRSTKREVAIKVMRQGPFATLADRARFDREIETLGRLDHPNIVAVHDAGVSGGFHYFVMNYVDGEPLDHYVESRRSRSRREAEAGPPSTATAGTPIGHREILELFATICDAVHAAHLRGIIHRDLKPSNIRVDQAGEPHVLDFGLARAADSQPDLAMTQTGQFVGSLPWASPEQVEGASSRVDLRTDVYSLGTMIFQLLTGTLPFDTGSNLRDAVDRILNREPPRPSAVTGATGSQRIDEELDTIILKCLSKDPERRYQSAGDLARDLRCYLAGDPIDAKRDSALYILRKNLRRYRVSVAVAIAFMTLFGVFSVVMALLYRHSSRLESAAVHSAETLSRLLSSGNIEQGRMAGVLGNLQQAEKLLWSELLTHREPGDNSALQLNWPPGPPEAYWALWELYRRYPCLRTLTPGPVGLRSLNMADDRTNFWTADASRFIQKLDPYGRCLDSWRPQLFIGKGISTVTPDGRAALYADNNRYLIALRDQVDQQPIEVRAAIQDLEVLSISQDASRCAGAIGNAAVVWQVDGMREIARFTGEESELVAAAISADGSRLAARDRMGGIEVWDINTRQRLARGRASPSARNVGHAAGQLVFSPDGRLLADAWLEMAGRIWDLTTDPPAAKELSERSSTHRIQAFSPDASILLVGDLGGAVRIFDTESAQCRSSFIPHVGRVFNIAFTDDGKAFWTSGDGDLRLWEITPDAGIRIVNLKGDYLQAVDASPDGRWLASGGVQGTLYRVDRRTGEVTHTSIQPRSTVSSIAFSPDSSQLAVATYANVVHVFPTERPGEPVLRLDHPFRVSFVSFSPDGTRIATACDDFVVRLWRTSDGRLEREFRQCTDRIPQVVFDPTGQQVAAVIRNGSLLNWDLSTDSCTTLVQPTQIPLRAVRYSRDGRWLAAAGADRTVNIWSLAGLRRVASLAGHNQEIYCLDLSPDGTLIATGDSGGTIRLWHITLQKPLATLNGHSGAVMALRFTADGSAIVSSGVDGTIREWDLIHYHRHVAGQVDTQLRKLASPPTASDAAAWRDWASRSDLP